MKKLPNKMIEIFSKKNHREILKEILEGIYETTHWRFSKRTSLEISRKTFKEIFAGILGESFRINIFLHFSRKTKIGHDIHEAFFPQILQISLKQCKNRRRNSLMYFQRNLLRIFKEIPTGIYDESTKCIQSIEVPQKCQKKLAWRILEFVLENSSRTFVKKPLQKL